MTYLSADEARRISRENRPASDIDAPLAKIMDAIAAATLKGSRYIAFGHGHGATVHFPGLDARGTRVVTNLLQELGYEVETTSSGFPFKKFTTTVTW